MQGYSPLLDLNIRWEPGELVVYDPSTGRPSLPWQANAPGPMPQKQNWQPCGNNCAVCRNNGRPSPFSPTPYSLLPPRIARAGTMDSRAAPAETRKKSWNRASPAPVSRALYSD